MITVDIDMSNTNNIIDHVAWQSNFNVVIPVERKRVIRAHRGQATVLRYNSNGTLLGSGGTDGIVKIYDARSGTARASLRGTKDTIMNVCFSSDDSLMLAAGNDQSARIWSMKSSRVLHTLLGHSSKIYAAGFTIDNECAITGSHDRTIRIWDLMKDGACKKQILCHSSCNNISLANNENYLASAHLDSHLRFWSIKTGELMHDADSIHTQQATSVEFSKDGTLVVSTSRDNTVKIVDVRTWKVLIQCEGTYKNEQYRNLINWNRAVFSPDGQYIVAGSASGNLFVWNTDTGKIVNLLQPPADANSIGTNNVNNSNTTTNSSNSMNVIPETAVSCVDWNRNGRQIVSSDMNGNLVFWEPPAA